MKLSKSERSSVVSVAHSDKFNVAYIVVCILCIRYLLFITFI
jgi:hypothetical protein